MRFRATLFVISLGVFLGGGCGHDGVAPPSYLDEPHNCPSLESMMPITLNMVERGELSELQAVVSEELDEPSQRLLIHMVTGVLKLVPPSRFAELSEFGQSEMLSEVFGLVHNLLVTMDSLSLEVQREFDMGLHRASQSCAMEPLLSTVQHAAVHVDTFMNVVPILLGGDGGVFNNSSVDPQSWLDLYVGLIEVVAALPGSEQDLQDLVYFVAALPGLEVLEELAVIFDDPEFLDHLGQTVGCLYEVEAAHGYGLLKGLAHISASQSLLEGVDLLASVVEGVNSEQTPDQVARLDYLTGIFETLIQGMVASPDLTESLRHSLNWFLFPDRAIRIRGDVALLLGSGAIEELLNAVSTIGVSDCPMEQPQDASARASGAL